MTTESVRDRKREREQEEEEEEDRQQVTRIDSVESKEGDDGGGAESRDGEGGRV